MKKISEYKKEALKALEGNWGTGVALYFCYLVCASVLSVGSSFMLSPLGSAWEMISNLSMLILIPMFMAIMVAFLRILRGNTVSLKELFAYYNWRVWTTILLKYVYILLWTCLLIIPGIVKAYSYALTEYILLDDPSLKNNEAIEKSMEMMKGKKMKMFLLDLSFIGWILLSYLTLGLGFFLLAPYMYTARASFYEDLKAEMNVGVIEEQTI